MGSRRTNSERRQRTTERPPGGGSRGDHYVTLKVVLPDPPDADLTRFVEDWGPKHPYPVR